ncbi:hypothetical protein [Arsukibacterium sp. MJ3]|jgi:hypothetical protein|uniref:hypothetical protein n=1 Tax=Arsukibacterium sp. MJ3 TaxID=1632859 RepID=UPI00128D5D4A|nr:hypothetical protein [Arsukibacterium sp. MJ3]
MSSTTATLRNIPNALAVFFDIVLRSKPICLGYLILAFVSTTIAIALESNHYIGRGVLYWIIGIAQVSSFTVCFLAPWVTYQIKLVLLIMIAFVLFQWW